MAREAGGTYEDTDGLINLPLTVKEIQAVVFFKQTEGDEYRVSMRSKENIDIGAVAKQFEGGGHKNAAGCTVTGSVDALEQLFVEKMTAGRSTRSTADIGMWPWTACWSSTNPSAQPLTTWSRVRRALGERRIGHTGTLDPAASGVLVLVARTGDKAGAVHGRRRQAVRRASFGWAFATDTYDAEGTTVRPPFAGPWPPPRVGRGGGRGVRGTFLQRPPAYSAKKIGGRRSYALARMRGPDSAHEPVATAGAGPGDGFRARSDRLRRRGPRAAAELLRRLLRAIAGARPGRAAGHGGASRRLYGAPEVAPRRLPRPSLWRPWNDDRAAALAAFVPMAAMLPAMPAAGADRRWCARGRCTGAVWARATSPAVGSPARRSVSPPGDASDVRLMPRRSRVRSCRHRQLPVGPAPGSFASLRCADVTC